jgi:hypothetical protein
MDVEDKRKRGRPPLLSAEGARMYRGVYGSTIHTSRQIQAHVYATRALIAMDRNPKSAREYPPATWLVDWAGANRGKQGAIKWGVLEELGRMLAVGMDIAPIVNQLETLEHGMTAKEAAAVMRRYRLRNGDKQ